MNDENIVGTSVSDTLFGGIASDIIEGLEGNDLIRAQGGDDTVFGGDGRDHIFGGDGDDVLSAGGDSLGGPEEYLKGGDGNDTYVITTSDYRTGVLSETATSGSSDRVVFEGMNFSDFNSIYQDADTNRLFFTFTNDLGQDARIRIQDFQNIESFEFADGSSVTSDQILARVATSAELETRFDWVDDFVPDVSGVVVNLKDLLANLIHDVFDHPLSGPDEYRVGSHAPGGAFLDYSDDAVTGEIFTAPNNYSHNYYQGIVALLSNQDDARFGTSGGDIIFGGGGNDSLNGRAGMDFLSGGSGDDFLDTDLYTGVLTGGIGDDVLQDGHMNDHLFGGAGNDRLNVGLSFDLAAGGDGNDVIVSRSDSGEPDQNFGNLGNLPVYSETGQHGLPFAEGSRVFDHNESAGVDVDDNLFGGAGNDLFVFEFTLSVPVDVSDPAERGQTLDWITLAGRNSYQHDHWVDGIGNDVIHDFEVGSDVVAFVGHTSVIESIDNTVDIDGNGFVDTVITLRSNHVSSMTGDPLAHHNDLLGTVTLLNASLTEADIGTSITVTDIPVHLMNGAYAIENTGVAVVDDYLREEYYDDAGNILDLATIVNSLGAFETMQAGDRLYRLINEGISNFVNGVLVEDRNIFGSETADTIVLDNTGGFVDSGAGDDMIIGSDLSAGQFGRDVLHGGAGDDFIHGGYNSDLLFGGAGNDYLQGGRLFDGTRESDPDKLFGGDGDDVLNGGMQGDELFGGAGNDIIMSGSDIDGSVEYDPSFLIAAGSVQGGLDFEAHAMGDNLFGNSGADTFVFDVLNAQVTQNDGTVSDIHASFGADVIHDFNAGEGDSLIINVHGADPSDVKFEVTDASVNGRSAAVINVISTTADDIYTFDVVETADIDGFSVGEIIIVGQTAAEVEATLGNPNNDEMIFNTFADVMYATDYYLL